MEGDPVESLLKLSNSVEFPDVITKFDKRKCIHSLTYSLLSFAIIEILILAFGDARSNHRPAIVCSVDKRSVGRYETNVAAISRRDGLDVRVFSSRVALVIFELKCERAAWGFGWRFFWLFERRRTAETAVFICERRVCNELSSNTDRPMCLNNDRMKCL
jgi:hypothetical protein